LILYEPKLYFMYSETLRASKNKMHSTLWYWQWKQPYTGRRVGHSAYVLCNYHSRFLESSNRAKIKHCLIWKLQVLGKNFIELSSARDPIYNLYSKNCFGNIRSWRHHPHWVEIKSEGNLRCTWSCLIVDQRSPCWVTVDTRLIILDECNSRKQNMPYQCIDKWDSNAAAHARVFLDHHTEVYWQITEQNIR
jgi:hypothetical protein